MTGIEPIPTGGSRPQGHDSQPPESQKTPVPSVDSTVGSNPALAELRNPPADPALQHFWDSMRGRGLTPISNLQEDYNLPSGDTLPANAPQGQQKRPFGVFLVERDGEKYVYKAANPGKPDAITGIGAELAFYEVIAPEVLKRVSENCNHTIVIPRLIETYTNSAGDVDGILLEYLPGECAGSQLASTPGLLSEREASALIELTKTIQEMSQNSDILGRIEETMGVTLSVVERAEDVRTGYGDSEAYVRKHLGDDLADKGLALIRGAADADSKFVAGISPLDLVPSNYIRVGDDKLGVCDFEKCMLQQNPFVPYAKLLSRSWSDPNFAKAVVGEIREQYDLDQEGDRLLRATVLAVEMRYLLFRYDLAADDDRSVDKYNSTEAHIAEAKEGLAALVELITDTINGTGIWD